MPGRRNGWNGVPRSLLILIVLWGTLTGGDLVSWVAGVPLIGLALLLRHRLNPFPAARVSARGAARFLVGFFRQSFVSGVDVVRRAFDPRLPLAPGMMEYRLRLRSVPQRMLLAGTVNLLPGTLSADLCEDRLTLHVLDLDAPILKELQEIESLVAGLHAAPPADLVSGEPHDPE